MANICSNFVKEMPKMNILVTGANGQLGNEIRILSTNSSDNYIFTDINQVENVQTISLDITDIHAIRTMVENNKVNVIINCAAYTNVDAAENNYNLAEKLNATAPSYLATIAKETGCLLIHISTDYVFGKEPYNTPCKEEQQGTPTGIYGLTKLHGEQKIQETGCQYIIIRTAWLYSEFGKNFCKTMINLTSTKPQLKVVFDQVGTPTYALDLAKCISIIVEDYKKEKASTQPNNSKIYSKSGIYHFSNEGVCSWYDFTKIIATYNGTTSCDIQPCHSNEFPSPVTRPSFSVLDKTKIKETFHVTIPYWTDSLKKCIANIKQWK